MRRLGGSSPRRGGGVKKERKKESGSVYSLGILAALRRMDTQDEPAA